MSFNLFCFLRDNFFRILGGSVPTEIGEMDGRNAASAVIGFVNGTSNIFERDFQYNFTRSYSFLYKCDDLIFLLNLFDDKEQRLIVEVTRKSIEKTDDEKYLCEEKKTNWTKTNSKKKRRGMQKSKHETRQ